MRPLRWFLRMLAVNSSGSASAMARLKRSAKDLTVGQSARLVERRDDVDALAARQQGKGDQPEVGEQVAQPHRRRLDLGEVEPDVGIEVEHQPVGLLERLDPAAPAVEFDRPHLDACEHALGVVDVEIVGDLAVALLDRHMVDRVAHRARCHASGRSNAWRGPAGSGSGSSAACPASPAAARHAA